MKVPFLDRLPQPLALAVLAGLLQAAFLLLRRLNPLDENLIGALVIALAASVVYFVAAWLVCSWRKTTPASLVVVLLAAVVFRATLFPLPPTLSDDLYRYVWEGEIQLAGQNPYLVTPDSLAGDLPELPDRPQPQDLPGAAFPTAYGPVTELLFRLAARVDGLAGFKLLSVAFDLATLLLIVGLLSVRREPPARALLYGWCPLVVIEFAASGHNDSIALFGLVLANALIIRERPVMSNLALAAAALSKWFAAVVIPVFWWRGRWWGLPAFLAAAGALLLPYREAGWGLGSGFFAYAEKWRNNESLYAILMAATKQESIAAGVGLGVVAGLAVYCAVKRMEPLRASYLLVGAVLLLSPSVFPWYVTWLVPFLCFFPNPGFLLFTATVLLSYHALIGYTAGGRWEYQSWLVWLEYLPVYALLLWSGWKWARAPAGRAQSSSPPRPRSGPAARPDS